MKIFFLLLGMSFLMMPIVQCQNGLNEKYVALKNGLIIRSEPSPEGIVLDELAFNEKVEIIEIKMLDTIEMRIANWVEVISVKKKRGYVFGGYLNSIRLPENEFSSLRAYLQELLDLYEVDYEVYHNENDNKYLHRTIVKGSQKHTLINYQIDEYGLLELQLFDWEIFEIINLIELSHWSGKNEEYDIFKKSINPNNLTRIEWVNGFDDPEQKMVLEQRLPKGIRILIEG